MVKIRSEITKISSNIEILTLQLNEFKPASGRELGVVRGEMFAEVAGRFSEIDAKVTKLAKQVAQQSKFAKETCGTL